MCVPPGPDHAEGLGRRGGYRRTCSSRTARSGALLTPDYWLEVLPARGLNQPGTVLISGTVAMSAGWTSLRRSWKVEMTDPATGDNDQCTVCCGSKWPHPSARKLQRRQGENAAAFLHAGHQAFALGAVGTSPVDVQRTEAIPNALSCRKHGNSKVHAKTNQQSVDARTIEEYSVERRTLNSSTHQLWNGSPITDFAGVSQKLLSHDDSGASTQLSKWDAGLDTSPGGIISHDFAEEVFLLSGELTDLTLNKTFLPGAYTSRQPNMPHGPYSHPHRMHHARHCDSCLEVGAAGTLSDASTR